MTTSAMSNTFEAPPKLRSSELAKNDEENTPSSLFVAPPLFSKSDTGGEASVAIPTNVDASITSNAWMKYYVKEMGAPPKGLAPSMFAADGDLDRALRVASLAKSVSNSSYTVVPSEWLEKMTSSGSFDSKLATMPGLMDDLNLPELSIPITSLASNNEGDSPPTSLDVLSSAVAVARPADTIPESNKGGRVYIDKLRQWDIVCGRGGQSNHHPGNKRYRQVVAETKERYRNESAKTNKTELSRSIVVYIAGYGGRFVKKDPKNGQYYLLTKDECRRKTSQALRETKELKWTLETKPPRD